MTTVRLTEVEAAEILTALNHAAPLADDVFPAVEAIIAKRLEFSADVHKVRLDRVRALADKWKREGVPVRGCKNADADEALFALQEALR